MTGLLLVEQSLNGLQFGLMLFLLAAGLTLVFGIMDMINLAHGSLYMVGAYLAAWFTQLTGSFLARACWRRSVLHRGVGMLLEAHAAAHAVRARPPRRRCWPPSR
jgi:branched-chain amino acid transport system permease protein